MKTLSDKINRLQAKAICKYLEFKNSERGDTNFISIIIIAAIVVALAGLLWTILSGGMNKVGNVINDFIDNHAN